MRENHCVGRDCEFTSRQALDAHCCSEDGYAADDSSGQSNTDPIVEAVVPPEPVPLATNNAMSGGVITTPSAPIHKMVKCINCDGAFVNIGAVVEHHKECLIGPDVACYAGTTTPITMTRLDPKKNLVIM